MFGFRTPVFSHSCGRHAVSSGAFSVSAVKDWPSSAIFTSPEYSIFVVSPKPFTRLVRTETGAETAVNAVNRHTMYRGDIVHLF